MGFICFVFRLSLNSISGNGAALIFRNYRYAYLSNNRHNHNLLSSEELKYNEQSVEIKTCGKLYQKWKEEKQFRDLQSDCLLCSVPFIDTHAKCNSCSKLSSPIILPLHGAPGSYKDFSLLTSYLHQRGARVIVPSFPDFQTFRPGIFRHTDEEKAEYIKDFLTAIEVPKIDVLVCHSSSIYSGLILCLENFPKIKSLVMLNPGTCSLKMRSIRNFKWMEKMVKASEFPVLLSLMKVVGPFVLKAAKVPVRVDDFLDPLLSATTMVHGNILKAKERFVSLSTKEFPILYIYSENDPLIGREPAYELACLLGASDSDIYSYDDEGRLKCKGKATHSLKVLSFEKGSHYVFWKYPDVVNEEIANFILNEQD